MELEKKKEERDKEKFQNELSTLMEKKYPEPGAKKVQSRMRHHQHVLFTCLLHDGVLPENNTAERAVRPPVVMRKIFGGSRSLAGAQAHQVNSSVLETLRQRNPEANFFDVILPLLEQRRSGA